MVEYSDKTKQNINSLEDDKKNLLAKLHKLQELQRINYIKLENNTRKRDINTFYQYLLMDYESTERSRDTESSLFRRIILGIYLKRKEIVIKKYFHEKDLEEILIDEYNLLEQYKDLCGIDSWCSTGISYIKEKLDDKRM